MSIEISLLNRLLDARDLTPLAEHGLSDASAWHDQVDAYTFILDHKRTYGELPSWQSVALACKTFERVETTESIATLCRKMRERNGKLVGRRKLEAIAKDFGKLDASTMAAKLRDAAEEVERSSSHVDSVVNWTRDVEEDIEEIDRARRGEAPPSIPLFWSQIDDAVGGFYRGDYVDIEAATKVGKSWLAKCCGIHANNAGYRVLEMLGESMEREAKARLDALRLQLPFAPIYQRKMSDELFEEYKRRKRDFAAAGKPDYIIRTPEDWPYGFTVEQIEADIDRFRPDVVILDQFSLIVRRGGHNETKDKRQTSADLKSLFARKGVLGVVITQANGDFVKRTDRSGDDAPELAPPTIGAYSDTIGVRQDCTHMIALDTISLPQPDGSTIGKGRIVVELSRTGGAGTSLDLDWRPGDGVIRPIGPLDWIA